MDEETGNNKKHKAKKKKKSRKKLDMTKNLPSMTPHLDSITNVEESVASASELVNVENEQLSIPGKELIKVSPKPKIVLKTKIAICGNIRSYNIDCFDADNPNVRFVGVPPMKMNTRVSHLMTTFDQDQDIFLSSESDDDLEDFQGNEINLIKPGVFVLEKKLIP